MVNSLVIVLYKHLYYEWEDYSVRRRKNDLRINGTLLLKKIWKLR